MLDTLYEPTARYLKCHWIRNTSRMFYIPTTLIPEIHKTYLLCKWNNLTFNIYNILLYIALASHCSVFTLICNSIYQSVNIYFTTLLSRLTTGYYNSLFHFLIFQKLRGTFICPNDTHCDSSDLLTTNIMNCFKHACEQIHDMFTQNQVRQYARNIEASLTLQHSFKCCIVWSFRKSYF